MKWTTEQKLGVGFRAALAILIVNALFSYQAARKLIENDRRVAHTHEVLAELEGLLSTMKDAETGSRGYIIAGDESYLEPYRAAFARINDRLKRIGELTADNPVQQGRLPLLEL